MAVASLVCAFLVAPLAIVFGHVALSQIKRSGERGRELAVAGLVLGYLFTVLAIVAIAITIYVIYALGQGMYGIASVMFLTPD
jgi:peptidyl-prolyl cis-trans isomerase B (cyclophilin B)